MINHLKNSPLYKNAFYCVKILQQQGYQAFFVGGCVRDAHLKRPINDIDIATNATANEVMRLFPQHKAVGAHFGVILVYHKKDTFEIATFRKDGPYKDGRHPSSVTFSDAKTDAQRRDFTINGLFYDPVKEEILDYVGGLKDLKEKTINTIGNPIDRFKEDKLRTLRCIRFYTQLVAFGFSIDQDLLPVLKSETAHIDIISKERIREEIFKMMLAPHAYKGLEVIEQLELENVIFKYTPSAREKLFFKNLKQSSTIFLPEFLLLSLSIENKSILPLLEKKFLLSKKEYTHLSNSLKLIKTFKSLTELPLYELKKFFRLPNIAMIIDFVSHWQTIYQPENSSMSLFLKENYAQYQNSLYPPKWISGETLLKLGLEPSPLFKDVLTEIENEQLNEVLKTKKDCEDFLLNWLKKKGVSY